jgi:hypothetical protein
MKPFNKLKSHYRNFYNGIFFKHWFRIEFPHVVFTDLKNGYIRFYKLPINGFTYEIPLNSDSIQKINFYLKIDQPKIYTRKIPKKEDSINEYKIVNRSFHELTILSFNDNSIKIYKKSSFKILFKAKK